MDTEDKITQLRRELHLTKEGQIVWGALLTKRSILEEKIIHMELEFEKETFEFHREGKGDPELLVRKREKLEEVKQNRVLVDELLDQYEETSTEMENRLKEELSNAILEQHPEKRTEYENLIHTLYLSSKNRTLNQELIDILKLISAKIEIILTERKKATPLGFFASIFGGSPAVSIIKTLEQLTELSKAAKEILEELGNGICGDLENDLKKLDETILERWTYRKIDKIYPPLLEKITACEKFLTSRQKDYEEQELKAKEELSNWLYKA